jgi:hypothetical protein
MRRSCLLVVAAAAFVMLVPPADAAEGLPGMGLAQHPFLYCGEWNFIHPDQTMYIVRGGKVVWSYSIPLDVTVYGKPEKEEYSDCTRLSNGNIVFSRRFGAGEVTPDKKIIWSYDAEPGTEVHTIQPIGKDKVLIVQNGSPAKLLLINTKSGKTEKQLIIPTAGAGPHGQFRRVRMTRAGTYLAAQMDMKRVVEYDATGKEIWSVVAPRVWAAIRLKSGNTLISGDQAAFVREVNPKGETVWEVGKNDLPGFPLADVQDIERLANGNTVICNWIAGDNHFEDWPQTVQIIEVTPDKKVVWALRQWDNPNLGPASSIQLLDEHGAPENGDLEK